MLYTLSKYVHFGVIVSEWCSKQEVWCWFAAFIPFKYIFSPDHFISSLIVICRSLIFKVMTLLLSANVLPSLWPTLQGCCCCCCAHVWMYCSQQWGEGWGSGWSAGVDERKVRGRKTAQCGRMRGTAWESLSSECIRGQTSSGVCVCACACDCARARAVGAPTPSTSGSVNMHDQRRWSVKAELSAAALTPGKLTADFPVFTNIDPLFQLQIFGADLCWSERFLFTHSCV